MIKVFLLSLVLLSPIAFAKESDYSNPWCSEMGGERLTLPDGTRPDCVLEYQAVEADFASKWYEAVGQALHYARMTHKQAAILLILESEDDERYLARMYSTIIHFQLPISVYILKTYE